MDKIVEENTSKYTVQRGSNINEIGFSAGENQMEQKSNLNIQ